MTTDRRWVYVLVLLLGGLVAGAPAEAQVPIGAFRIPELVHPDPRPGVTGRRVVSARQLRMAGQQDAVAAYDLAREIPQVLDGLHSYCNVGRSLLSCFEQPVGARCDYCMLVVRRAHRLHEMGKSLEFIRRWHVEPAPQRSTRARNVTGPT